MSWRHGAQPKTAAAPAAKRSSLLALVAASNPQAEAPRNLPPQRQAPTPLPAAPAVSASPKVALSKPPLAPPRVADAPLEKESDNTESSVEFSNEDEVDDEPSAPRARVVVGGDDFDEEFTQAVEEMLESAEHGLSMEQYEPFEDVVKILTALDGSDSSIGDIEKKLSRYYDLEEDSTAQVSSYVDRHHSHFNDSIQHFAQMVMSVYDVQESLAALKRDSSMASMALDSHADELRAAHTCAVRAALTRQILTSVEKCSRLATSADASISEGRYLNGARQLKELESILDDPMWEELGSTSSFRQYCERVSAQLPSMVIDNLLKEVFEVPQVESVDKIHFRVPTAGIEALTMDIDGDGGRVVQWIEALRVMGHLDEFREKMQLSTSEGLEKVLTARIQRFMVDARKATRVDHSGVHREANAATTEFLTNRRMAEASLLSTGSSSAMLMTLEEATVAVQETSLRSLLVLLCNDVCAVLSTIEYIGRVVAAIELPYVDGHILQGTLNQACELWQYFPRMDAFDGPDFEDELAKMMDNYAQLKLPNKSSASALYQDLRAVSMGVAETKPKLSQPTMLKLWEALPERIFIQRHAAGGVGDALGYIREIGEFLEVSAKGTMLCVGAVLASVPSALRSITLSKYRQVIQEWDLTQAYARAGAHFDTLCRALCNISSIQMDTRVQEGLSGKSHRRRHKSVPAAKEDYRHLSTQLSTSASHGPGPRFIEELGYVGFSLSTAAATLQRDTRPLVAKITSKDESSLPSVLRDLPSGLLLSIHNAPIVYQVVASMDAIVKDKGRLIAGTGLWVPLGMLEVFLVSTYATSLRQQHVTKLKTSFTPFLPVRDIGAVRTIVDTTSRCELLASVVYCDKVLAKVARLTDGLPLYVSDEIQRQSAESVIDDLVLATSRCIDSISQGSFAGNVVFPAFDNALKSGKSKSSASWAVMRNEANVYGSLVVADKELMKSYTAQNAERTSGYDRRQNVESSSNTSKLLTSPHNVGALACICRSFEWLGAVFLARIWPHAGLFEADSIGVGGDRLWAPLEDIVSLGLSIGDAPPGLLGRLQHSLIPGTVFFKGYNTLSGRLREAGLSSVGGTSFAPARRALSLYERIVTVSQASLFMLAVDLRCAPLLLLPQLRDETFNVVAASPKADAVVQRLNHHLAAQLAVVSSHLLRLKQKYLALSLARPIADLFLGEMGLLRDRRITDAGQQRLTLDLLHIQSTLLLFAPGDAELGDAVHDYLGRARLFISHIRNPNVVTDLLASGAFKALSDKDISTLVSLVFQSGQREGVEAIMSFRRRVAALQEETVPIHTIPEPPSQPRDESALVPAVSPKTPIVIVPSEDAKSISDDESDQTPPKGGSEQQAPTSEEDSYSYSYSYTSDGSDESDKESTDSS